MYISMIYINIAKYYSLCSLKENHFHSNFNLTCYFFIIEFRNWLKPRKKTKPIMAFRDKSASSILPYTCVYIGMWIVLTSRNLLICVTLLAQIYVLKQPYHVSNWQMNLNGEVLKYLCFIIRMMNLKACMMCTSRCVLNNFNNKRFKLWKKCT